MEGPHHAQVLSGHARLLHEGQCGLGGSMIQGAFSVLERHLLVTNHWDVTAGLRP